jgi:hypothetical protein
MCRRVLGHTVKKSCEIQDNLPKDFFENVIKKQIWKMHTCYAYQNGPLKLADRSRRFTVLCGPYSAAERSSKSQKKDLENVKDWRYLSPPTLRDPRENRQMILDPDERH